jgi:cytochrome P450
MVAMAERGRLPPGPPLPAHVQTALWLGRPIGFLEWCARRYGDCFTLRLVLGPPMVVVGAPALAASIFTLAPELASAAQENAVLEPLLGPRSVLMLDGPEHLRQRRLLLPIFVGERMRRHEATIAEIVGREVDRWPTDRPFSLLPRMRAITMEVILRIVFGLEDPARLAELRSRLDRLLGLGSSWLMLPWMRRDLGPWSPWGRFLRAKADVDRRLMAEIARRRVEPRRGDGDALGQLLEARDDQGRGMSDAEVRDELVTLLVAGHETTATTLSWCFELLLRHPDALDRLVADLRAGSRRVLEGVIRETLRLRSPFRLVSRRLRAPVELGPWTLPPGVALAANVHLVHRSDAYREPDAFRPERYFGGRHESAAWIPFGGGHRRCIGASFATFEMATVLRAVLARVRLRPASRRPEGARLRAVILVPSRGARVVVEELCEGS